MHRTKCRKCLSWSHSFPCSQPVQRLKLFLARIHHLVSTVNVRLFVQHMSPIPLNRPLRTCCEAIFINLAAHKTTMLQKFQARLCCCKTHRRTDPSISPDFEKLLTIFLHPTDAFLFGTNQATSFLPFFPDTVTYTFSVH